MRLTALLALALIGAAQTNSPVFDVTSVKLNRSGQYWWTIDPMPDKSGHFSAHNGTLKALIGAAYEVEESRIVGGPGWLATDRFDVEAKTDSQPDRAAVTLMLRSLLVERFQLAVHREQRDLPRYALVAPKPKPQLKSAAGRVCIDHTAPGCTGFRFSKQGITAENVPLSQLARALTDVIGRMVVDETGLSGGFDFKVEWSPSPDSEAISTALWEQLGLKLESRKGPTDALVIDRAERPSAN